MGGTCKRLQAPWSVSTGKDRSVCRSSFTYLFSSVCVALVSKPVCLFFLSPRPSFTLFLPYKYTPELTSWKGTKSLPVSFTVCISVRLCVSLFPSPRRTLWDSTTVSVRTSPFPLWPFVGLSVSRLNTPKYHQYLKENKIKFLNSKNNTFIRLGTFSFPLS